MNPTDLDVLLDLPKDFCADILTKWLLIEDIAALDSAYANKTKRVAFFETVDSEVVVFPNDPFLNNNLQSFMEWIVKRRIRISRIKLNESVNLLSEGTKGFFELTGKQLRTISVHNIIGDISVLCSDIAFSCPNLTKLVIMHSDVNGGIRAVFKGCTRIEELRIYECVGVSASHFHSIRCPKLTTVDVSFCADAATLIAIAQCCPNLVKLDISYCETVSDEAVLEVAAKCPKLQVLGCFKNAIITDQSIVRLAESCHDLTAIDIASCPLLTDASIIALAQHCKGLRRIFMQSNDNFGSPALIAISEECRQLHTLYCGHCPSITDEGVVAVAKKCPELRRLVMGDNDLISDEGVAAVVTACPKLHELGIGALNITDVAAKAVAQLCGPYLQQLDIQESVGITAAGVYQLSQQLTQLNTLIITEQCTVVTELAQKFWQQNMPGLVISTDPSLITYFIFD